ncbi:MAG TPA: hypothetical protein PLK12_03360 [Prolixibacteraceae bacterium]|nr:hypothetical protein [Prolixibacteraceae bacterium]
MKKTLLFVLIVFLILILGGLWYRSCSKINIQKRREMSVREVPGIVLNPLTESAFRLNEYPYDSFLIILLFSRECDFCLYELEELKRHHPFLHEASIFLVSFDPVPSLRQFEMDFRSVDFPGMCLCHCPYDSLVKHFGKLSVPDLYIYAQNGTLIEHFCGATRMDAILGVLEEHSFIQ